MHLLVTIASCCWLLASSDATAAPPNGNRAEAVDCGCKALFESGATAELEARLEKLVAEDAMDVVGLPLALACSAAFRNPTSAELAALDHWVSASPTSYAARMIAGHAWYSQGLAVRGTGYADTVSDAAYAEMLRCMARAKALFLDAEKLRPRDPLAPTLLMKVLTYDGSPTQEATDAFGRAVAARPDWGAAYEFMATYLEPKWHGTPQQLLRFARAVTGSRPSNPRLLMLLPTAHRAIRTYRQDDAYFRDATAWRETRDASLSYLAIRDWRIGVWGSTARLASEAGDDETFLYCMKRFYDLKPAPGTRVDGFDMATLHRRASAMLSGPDARVLPEQLSWTTVPLGTSPRAAAEAALQALRPPAAVPEPPPVLATPPRP